MEIGLMAGGDLVRVAKLEKLCFSVPWSLAVLEAGFKQPNQVSLVLRQRGDLVAYAVAAVIAGEGEIQRIAVHPACRGQGIGKKLLAELEKKCIEKGASSILLEVRKSNLAARKMYAVSGFLEEAVRKNYYRHPTEDALILWKRNLLA